jgi:hypothetical protein
MHTRMEPITDDLLSSYNDAESVNLTTQDWHGMEGQRHEHLTIPLIFHIHKTSIGLVVMKDVRQSMRRRLDSCSERSLHLLFSRRSQL